MFKEGNEEIVKGDKKKLLILAKISICALNKKINFVFNFEDIFANIYVRFLLLFLSY